MTLADDEACSKVTFVVAFVVADVKVCVVEKP